MKDATARFAALAAAAAALATANAQQGEPVGGALDESDRVYPPVWQQATAADSRLLGRAEEDAFWFELQPPAEGGVLVDSVLYLDLDQDMATGYKDNNAAPLNLPSGFEAFITVSATGATLYTGCPDLDTLCDKTEVDAGAFLFETKGAGVRLRVPRAVLEFTAGGAVGEIGVATQLQHRDLNDVWTPVFAPPFFLNYYPLFPDLRERLNGECAGKDAGTTRGAVVYSTDQRTYFFDERAYMLIYTASQSQLMQAGVPHDRITLEELLDIDTACRYSLVVLPYLANVSREQWQPLLKALYMLVHVYGVGVVFSGELASNQPVESRAVQPGDPYFLMSTLGLEDSDPISFETSDTVVKVNDASSLFRDRAVGETIMDKDVAGLFVSVFKPVANPAYDIRAVATQTVKPVVAEVVAKIGEEATLGSIHTMELTNNMFGRASGRIVHYSTPAVYGNQDLAWRGMEWAARAHTKPAMGLRMTRKASMTVCRNDMDQSRFFDEAKIVEPALFNMAIQPWYQDYSFVCSYYINIGENQAEREFTDWAKARNWYGDYMALENEMGSHSYNHPPNINLLTPAELKHEFDDAQAEIMQELGLSRLGTAQPGAGDTIETAEELEQYFTTTYFSGGYAGVGSGYPGAFGFMRPDSEMVYIAPNMFFDFSLIEFWKVGIEQAELRWAKQWDESTKFAKMPIIHWPIHDYGPTDWDDVDYKVNNKGLYNLEMFTNFIERAYNDGTEFITGMQLHDRIRVFDAAELSVTHAEGDDKTLIVRAAIPTAATPEFTMGGMALELSEATQQVELLRISSVQDWYAYSDTKVFLPSDGGEFRVQLDTDPGFTVNTDVTRITDISMRTELVSVEGDGVRLAFTVRNQGTVRIALSDAIATADKSDDSKDATFETVDGVMYAVFTFTEPGLHTGAIDFKNNSPRMPSVSPTAAPSARDLGDSPSPSPDPPQHTGDACPVCAGGRSTKRKGGMGVKMPKCRLSLKFSADDLGEDLCHGGTHYCDFHKPGAINEDPEFNSIDTKIACGRLWTQNDMRSLKNVCQESCSRIQNCKAWTLNKDDGVCYLYECKKVRFVEWDSMWIAGKACKYK